MRRDLHLVRRILLHVEAQGEDGAPAAAGFQGVSDDSTSPETVHYHVQLLHDAGLIVADELVPGQWWPERITWDGHEFLDLARDEETWRSTIADVEARAGSAPFRVVWDMLARRIGTRLSRSTRKK